MLVEAAHFDQRTVARSSRRHKLVSEASKRFERGVDPKVTAAAAQRAVDLLVKYGGGTVDPGVTDVDHTGERPAYRLDTGLPGRLVGLDYPHERVLDILRQLGCSVDDIDTATADITPPSWRPDLCDGPDYAEEVARIDGYDRIPSVLPAPVAGTGLTHGQWARRVVATALAGRGFTEVLSYPFVAESLADDLGIPAHDPRRSAIRVANPLSEQAPLMRTSVLDTLVDAVRRNVSRGQRDLALFELGMVTRPAPGSTHTAPVPGVELRPDEATIASMEAAVPPQPRHLAVVLAGEVERSGWWGKGRAADWSDAVEAVRVVAAALAVSLRVEPAGDYAPWHPGRCARLTLVDGTILGYAGELRPKVLARLGLPARTCAAEVDLDALCDASVGPVQLVAFSTQPVALTDIAMTVDDAIPAQAVAETLRAAAGPLLESVALFDEYRGGQVEGGQRSLAFRLAFRAPDRTLTTDEVSALRDTAVAAAAEAFGAVQR